MIGSHQMHPASDVNPQPCFLTKYQRNQMFTNNFSNKHWTWPWHAMVTAFHLFISSLLHLNYLIPVGLCKSHLMYIMLLNATLPLTFWNSDTIETSSCEQTEDLEVHRILQSLTSESQWTAALQWITSGMGFFLHWQTNADVHATSILNLDQWYNM